MTYPPPLRLGKPPLSWGPPPIAISVSLSYGGEMHLPPLFALFQLSSFQFLIEKRKEGRGRWGGKLRSSWVAAVLGGVPKRTLSSMMRGGARASFPPFYIKKPSHQRCEGGAGGRISCFT
nr:hypothetical protein [Morchella crassipes]